MAIMIGIGNRLGQGGSVDWEAYWLTQPEVLFFGLYSEISGGQMPNKVTGATDYLTVAGSAGSETYQCPNTAPYIAADTDYIWFKADASQRTATTAELIGYDLQRTPVKYEDDAPNAIIAIIILNAAVTGEQRNRLFRDMWLSVLWDNNLNAYGHIKSNRVGQQLWTPEAVYEAELLTYITGLSTPLSSAQLANLDAYIVALKTGLSISALSEVFDCMYILAGETEESSLKNLVKNAHHCTKEGTVNWTQFEGSISDGSTGYLHHHYNPSTQADNWLIGSAAMGHYSRTDTDTGGYDVGINNSVAASEHYRAANNFAFKVNADMSARSTLSLDGRGMFISSRTTSILTTPYVNKVAGTTTNEAERAITNQDFYSLARNTPAGVGNFSDRQLSLIFFSRGLSQAEVDVITDSFEAYMDANGKGVI